MTNDAPRRRRRRRGHRGGGANRPREAVPHDEEPARAPEAPWQWRTFPVAFAFAIGALVMGGLVLIAPGAFVIFLVGAVFLTIFGVAHFFGRSLRAYREDDGED